jgi:hypothetical protein
VLATGVADVFGAATVVGALVFGAATVVGALVFGGVNTCDGAGGATWCPPYWSCAAVMCVTP